MTDRKTTAAPPQEPHRYAVRPGQVVLYYRSDPENRGGELVPREPLPAHVVRVYNRGDGVQADLIVMGWGGQAANASGKDLHKYKGGVFPRDLAMATRQARWFEPLI